ncbi:LuxE/PaaK family acyltransferase [Croceiramulus getboli]|nr:acyl transferase [Flavobacteriaceae bacterium YJPT1-3]
MNALDPDFNPFRTLTPREFDAQAMHLFEYQYDANPVYRAFCDHLNRGPKRIQSCIDIPHLPISFFKSHAVQAFTGTAEQVFTSSGTTGAQTSKHFVKSLTTYERSFRLGFERAYGEVTNYAVLCLLPAYGEREGSSLVYMAQDLIVRSQHPASGFYLHDRKSLANQLKALETAGQPTLLLGVSFALLDLAAEFPMALRHTLIMETGGMKGRRKEMIREELHQHLQNAFQLDQIHSEYSMTELLSQAYSQGSGIYHPPPWMRVSARDPEDALSRQKPGRTGGLNIIDLANRDSCAFIATQDLGRVYEDGSFEVLGRFDHSDIRGCNLMAL